MPYPHLSIMEYETILNICQQNMSVCQRDIGIDYWNNESILDICQQDISVRYWKQLTREMFLWLMQSPMRSLLLGGLFVIAFLIISGLLMRGFLLLGRGRSIKRLWLWGFPLSLLLSVSPLLIGEPLLTSFLPAYNGQTADAVVVLGRGKHLRVSRAAMTAQLMLNNAAPKVFLSGGGDAPTIAIMLAKLGVSPSQISGENCSKTTEQNGFYTAQQLLLANVHSIILVTDPTHLWRSKLVFNSYGFDVIPYASPLPDNIGLRYRRLLAMRESLGLITYGLMGRYWPRTIAAVETTVAQ